MANWFHSRMLKFTYLPMRCITLLQFLKELDVTKLQKGLQYFDYLNTLIDLARVGALPADPRPFGHARRLPGAALPWHRAQIRAAVARYDRLRRSSEQHPGCRDCNRRWLAAFVIRGWHRKRRISVAHLHGCRRIDRLWPVARQSEDAFSRCSCPVRNIRDLARRAWTYRDGGDGLLTA